MTIHTVVEATLGASLTRGQVNGETGGPNGGYPANSVIAAKGGSRFFSWLLQQARLDKSFTLWLSHSLSSFG
jgi:hypothetical protein